MPLEEIPYLIERYIIGNWPYFARWHVLVSAGPGMAAALHSAKLNLGSPAARTVKETLSSSFFINRLGCRRALIFPDPVIDLPLRRLNGAWPARILGI